ncbi:phosphoribosylformylglycinamidine synthase subunit PurS [Candidatus Bathyarchaeota archaeon]|nr:phosphoribosylformylglycinamidine synthase subunit PurS [Candidatus Bathyarchaeota archaeon]
MRFKAIVYVKLKEGYSDPEGETTAKALKGLGYKVIDVRVSKAYRILLEAADAAEAERLIEEMSQRLLSNPTKDDYRYEISEVEC